MINANLIRAKIVEHGMTQKTVAEKIGMSEKTFSIKMNNGKFGLDEVDKMIDLLKIEQPERYFFADVVTCEGTDGRTA